MEGYKDGFYGLALCLLQAFSEMIVVLKIWELTGFKDEHLKLDDLERKVKKAERIRKYWFINERLKAPQNSLNSFYLRILRKIYS